MLSTWQNGSVVVGVSLQFKVLQRKLKKMESLNTQGEKSPATLKGNTIITLVICSYVS